MLTVLSGILAVWAAILAIFLLAGKPANRHKNRELDELRRKHEELTKAVEVLTGKKTEPHGTQAAMRGTGNPVFPSQAQAQTTPEAGSDLASLGIGRA